MDDSFFNGMSHVGQWRYGSAFADACCGPRSLLRERLRTAVSGRPDADTARRDLANGLDVPTDFEATDFETNPPSRRINPPYGDATIGHRWAALSATARAVLAGHTTEAGRALLNKARAEFLAVNEQLGIADVAEPAPTSVPLFDDVGGALAPWTAASWMVWDVLTDLRDAEPHATALRGAGPYASERTWLLSAPLVGTAGMAFRLVVEAVPGPAELVVPDWWKLGLFPFPTDRDKRKWFVPAIQEAMSRVVREHPRHRLRWHVEPPREGQWWAGLAGRSGTTAAAVVARAAVQRLEENLAPDAQPVLDSHCAVTAELGDGAAQLERRELRPVDEGTLAAKFWAARHVGIDTVFIATNQPGSDNTVPGGVNAEQVGNFRGAYDRMRSLERAFDNYREANRRNFVFHEPPP